MLFYFQADCYHEESGGVLSTTTAVPAPHAVTAEQRRRAVLTIVACTLIGAAAQVLIKMGGANLQHAGLIATAIGILTIPTLFAGYCLYGIFAALMVYALRHGELSLLYPIIALTYVWVTILSVLVFHETITPFKGIGIAIIVCGVAVLGRGGTR
jgi:drug/metabolite transporter (DMT)-like permease